MRKGKQIAVWLPPAVYAMLKARAERQSKFYGITYSMTAVIIRALARECAKDRKKGRGR